MSRTYFQDITYRSLSKKRYEDCKEHKTHLTLTSSISFIYPVVLAKMLLYSRLISFLQAYNFCKKLLILIPFLFLFAPKGIGQVSLLAESFEATTGQTVSVPIKVTGFKNIVSMQFSIDWDSTVLEFKEVLEFTEELPQFGKDGIGDGNVSSGNLIVAWIDNSVRGVNLEDSTAILTLQFQVIGEEGSKSLVRFSEIIEFADATSTILETVLIEGQVAVPDMSTATTYLQAQNGMRLFQNHPNPFHKNTTIKTSFEEAELVLFTITDIQGRVVYRKQFQSNSGVNHISLDGNLLPTSGIYQYTIQGSNYQLSKQMIFLP